MLLILDCPLLQQQGLYTVTASVFLPKPQVWIVAAVNLAAFSLHILFFSSNYSADAQYRNE